MNDYILKKHIEEFATGCFASKSIARKTLCGRFVHDEYLADKPESATCEKCKDEWEQFSKTEI